MKITTRCTNPNYVPKVNIPNQETKSMGIKVSITDMDIFKNAIQTLLELVKDKEISENIRYKYLNKLMEIIDIEDYHIEL